MQGVPKPLNFATAIPMPLQLKLYNIFHSIAMVPVSFKGLFVVSFMFVLLILLKIII